MNSSSKVQSKGPTLKYTVLKPYPKILSLSRAFKRTFGGQNYELAVEQDFGVRKYSLQVNSFQQSLRQAQWRYDCLHPIVRCLYVQLLSPDSLRCANVDLYVTHLELVLTDLKQLLIQEAIYLIVESLKGYETLLDNYRKVSVNDHTIGISSNGECQVWINRFLEKSECEQKFMTSPLQIVYAIVKLVKERSEPVCRKFLAKVQDVIESKRPNFREALDIVRCFVNKNGIKVPHNLKYLLHQHRIKSSIDQLQSLKVSMRNVVSLHEQNENFNIVVKSPTFLKNEHKQRASQRPASKDLALLCAPKDIKKLRKYSANLPGTPTIRKTIQTPEPFFNCFSLSQQPSLKTWSGNDSNHSGDIKTKHKLDYFQDKLKQNKATSSKSKSKFKSSNSFDDICIVNVIKPKDEGTLRAMKRFSGESDHTRAGNSCIHRSSNTNSSDISFEAETVKKIAGKSSIQFTPQKINESNLSSNFPIMENSSQNSIPISPLQSLEPTFHCIPEKIGEDHIKEEVIKNNNWTKTFKNLINAGAEANLNVSISDGQEEVSTYLSDIQLEKLDTLSRQMVMSMESKNSEQYFIDCRDPLNS